MDWNFIEPKLEWFSTWSQRSRDLCLCDLWKTFRRFTVIQTRHYANRCKNYRCHRQTSQNSICKSFAKNTQRKIMRRILRKMVEQDFVDVGHTSTLLDSAEVEEIKAGKVRVFISYWFRWSKSISTILINLFLVNLMCWMRNTLTRPLAARNEPVIINPFWFKRGLTSFIALLKILSDG